MSEEGEIFDTEFSRIVDRRRLGDGIRRLQADPAEREALARRFGLVAIDRLEARITLTPDGTGVVAEGQMVADIVQSCAVSAEDLPVEIDEPIMIRFVPEAVHGAAEEIELTEADCDVIEHRGDLFDLGEAVAQSLALAIDPFATGPAAEAARDGPGLVADDEAGPFAALRALRKD